MRRQIEIVEMGIWVARRRLAHDNRAMYAVEFLQASVSVPEVSSRITGPLVSARWKRDQKFRLNYFVKISRLHENYADC